MVIAIQRAEATARARQTRLLVTDVDGVWTDGGVYCGVDGEALVRFSRRDGMAVELLREAGIQTAIATRESSAIVLQRAKKLGIELCFTGERDKRRVVRQLLEQGFAPGALAYIGDDVNDLGILRAIADAGLTAAPADAVDNVLDAVHYRCTARGGHGAFREFADFILQLRTTENNR